MALTGSSYDDGAALIGVMAIIIGEGSAAGESIREIASLRHVADAVKANQVLGYNSDWKDAFIFKSNRISGMNAKVSGTEHARIIRHGVHARLAGRGGKRGSGRRDLGQRRLGFAEDENRYCHKHQKENNKQPGYARLVSRPE